MTGNTPKQIFKLFGLIIAILILCGINLPAAQDKPSPLSDYQYSKIDFPRYDGIKKEANAQTRSELLLSFIESRSISKLLLYSVNDYLECVNQITKDPAKAIPMIEKAMALLPTEEKLNAADIPAGKEEYIKTQLTPSRVKIYQTLISIYDQAKNYPKAAEALESLYAIAPDKSLLPVMANVYGLAKNDEKRIFYLQKTLTEIPIEQSYATAIDMAQIYMQKNDMKAATDLLSKIMDVYGDKVPQGYDESRWNAIRAYAYSRIATIVVYPTKDYPKIIEAYEKVLKFDPKNEEAYYFIGMSKWRMKDQPGAIDSFTKCVAINGPNYAAKAKQNLEQLTK
jgi:tetratricopeptide (TPR) repeat protein